MVMPSATMMVKFVVFLVVFYGNIAVTALENTVSVGKRFTAKLWALVKILSQGECQLLFCMQ